MTVLIRVNKFHKSKLTMIWGRQQRQHACRQRFLPSVRLCGLLIMLVSRWSICSASVSNGPHVRDCSDGRTESVVESSSSCASKSSSLVCQASDLATAQDQIEKPFQKTGKDSSTQTDDLIPKLYGLLSIDGGGTRGIIPAKIIEILELQLRSKFSDLFDFAAGTSTGGILVMSSMLRQTNGSDLVKLYHDLSKEVFPPEFRLTEYPAEPLEKLLAEHFGNETMTADERKPNVFVVTKLGTNTFPHLLTNYAVPPDYSGESGWTCAEAGRATTAAPTYFKPFKKHRTVAPTYFRPYSKEHETYRDGGLGFNNPVQLVYEEALRVLQCDSQQIAYIVSLGTGQMPQLLERETNINILRDFSFSMAYGFDAASWVLSTLHAKDLAVQQVTESGATDYHMKVMCDRLKIPYFRFNPYLEENYDLTDTKHSDVWIRETEKYMNTSSNVNKLLKLIEHRKQLKLKNAGVVTSNVPVSRMKKIIWSRHSPSNPPIEWKRYSDFESDCIETEHGRSVSNFQLDDNRVIDFTQMKQTDKNGKTEVIERKTMMVVSEPRLREERFCKQENFVAVGLSLIDEWKKISPESHEEIVEQAINGILKEGRLLDQQEVSQMIASSLRRVKDEDKQRIGELCTRLYTADTFLYKAINSALATSDISKRNTLGGFAYLLDDYLFNDPCYHNQDELTLYRGGALTDDEIIKFRNAKGKFIQWGSFISTTTDEKMARSCGNTLFIIKEDICGRDISTMSLYPEEKEILLKPGRKYEIWEVAIASDLINGKHLIYLFGLPWNVRGSVSV